MFATFVGVLILFVKLSVISTECEKTFIVTCESFSDVTFNKSKHTWTELLVQRPKTSDFTSYYTLDVNSLSKKLTKLKGLIIHRQLNKLHQNAFTYLKNLKYLILYDNDLKVIEKRTFFKFKLEKLSLSHNRIHHIESRSFSLSQIVEIDLSDNNLSTLSDTIFERCDVNKLVLSHNKLKQISNLCLPTTLKVLNLDYNVFHHIPRGVSSLKQLEEFTMSHNEIYEVTALDFKNFSSLRIVDLSFNFIESIDNTFESLEQLEYLNLAHNELSKFIFTPALTQIVTSKSFVLLLAHNNLRNLNLPNIEDDYISTLALTLSLNPWECDSISAIDQILYKSQKQYFRTTCDQNIYSFSNIPCCVVSDSPDEALSYTWRQDFKKLTAKIDCDVYTDLSASSY